ncbi:hypothetical protein EC991_001823 [Linnemannia zychae]|nr:hypothetical protein EC991_001823 [Linnemannia zychae]
MADCLVNLAEDSQITTLAVQPASSEGSQASLDAKPSSSTTTVIDNIKESSRPATAHRWYFQESETDEPAKKLNLTMVEEQKPPVKIDASRKSIIWNIPLPSNCEEGGLYDIVLGVSVQDLDIDCIDSILLRFDQLAGTNEGFEYETIRAKELKRLTSVDQLDKDKKGDQGQDTKNNDNVFLWKLFFRCYGNDGGATITMFVNTWPDLPHKYGSLELHFVELCTDSLTLHKADTLYREHCPYASWLIDFNRSGCPEYDAMTDKIRSFTNLTFSGDGRFAAFRTKVGEEKYLEVWSLEDVHAVTHCPVEPDEATDSQDDNNDDKPEKSKVIPHQSTPVAWIPLSDKDHDVSFSWDGSLLALLDRTQPSTGTNEEEKSVTTHESEFAIFQCSRGDNTTSEKVSSRMNLIRYDVQQTCPGLRNYTGNGVFHMVDGLNPDLKDELFITCDGVTIEIYKIFETWAHLRSITIDSSVTSVDHAPDYGEALFNRTRGRYFIAANSHSAFTIDIMEGALVSFTSTLLQEDLRLMNYLSAVSKDGTLIAVPGFRQVNIYWTKTWTLHGSYVFQEIASDERLFNVTFASADSLLLVTTAPVESLYSQTRPGYILDVATMTVAGRMVPDGHSMVGLAPLNGSEQGLICPGFSQIWNARLEDRNYLNGQRYPDRCTSLCESPDYRDSGVLEGTSSSGLRFKAQKIDAAAGSHLKRDKRSSLTVTMTSKDGSQVKKVAIPLPNGVSFRSAAFFSDFKYLSVVTGNQRMAWTVPTTFDGDFRLRLILSTATIRDWMICPHGFVRCRIEEKEEFSFVDHIMHPVSNRLPAEGFLGGVGSMIEVYDLAEPGVRQDILRLYGNYLNRDFDGQMNMIYFLAYIWGAEYHQVLHNFIKDLLEFPGTRWVPPQNMLISQNPLAPLLEAAKTEPLANTTVQLIVDYCLRQAKAEQDPHFLLPIQQCLHLFVDPKGQYSEMALIIYREMAYFPAQGRDFIIEHHALSNPLTFRWRFWKSYPWGLHQYKDQVLQLETVKIPSPPKGNFTREIFQASFDMLWRKPEAEESQDGSEDRKNANALILFSWPKAIWTMVLRKCRLKYTATVECYPFELQALDNPALMALVEFKWNTIGFHYWFIRFLGQLCYYVLVLTAVFLQIYGKNHRFIEVVNEAGEKSEEVELLSDPHQEGLFIAIIVTSFTFLWLELVQFMKDKRGYVQSVYNLVDFWVFLLPLVGAINEMLIINGAIEAGLNPGILSFSVLLVFLHFLFELRVFQVVCHFVSIIIRAIYSIRVFIFVFSGGLFAFAIAILHLLHTCINADQCTYFTEGFSNNLFRAVSLTYFMMGGNYDQVETGFTSNSVAFHAMMMVFFFFTVIVMLNVLIALVNNAINDGDQTWQLDWLEYRMRYVESAENMTYDISGFREQHNYFPDTIYYTGTPQQVRDFEKKSKQMMEDASSAETTIAPITMAATSVAVVTSKSSDKINDGQNVDNTTDPKMVPAETDSQKQLGSEQVKSEKQIEELQQQLNEQQQMLKEQQQVMKEQQQLLLQILGKLGQ